MVAYLFILATSLVAVLCVHELGHLLTARYYGIKVLDLSVGLLGSAERVFAWPVSIAPFEGRPQMIPLRQRKDAL